MYLVSGATGNVGGEVVRALADQGLPVRAVVRSAARWEPVEHVEAVEADLDDPATLDPWLDGVEGAFLLPGFPDMPGLYRKLREAGVVRVVQLSGSSAESGDTANAVTAMMLDTETAARESGLLWTILRPSGFDSNALRWLPQLREGDLVRAPWGEIPVACIDPADIAAVAATALTNPGHEGAIHRISGPRPMLPAEQIAVLARVLDRPLRFENLSPQETRFQLESTMPQPFVDAFLDFYVKGSLDESPVFRTVEEITGRPPRTFEQWAEAHAADFR
ncbi:NAD(P)H-binding protein [Glycomyces endophyticus]|uniref:NAD(P)H-binding protein n=1 Tax=Glycomyces endophyticus TaxID=480996 RepID=A0ABN2H2A0_9ACTN